MPDRFDRLTGCTVRALIHARAEARRVGQRYVASEHVLLGVLHEQGSSASRVLRLLGIDPQAVYATSEIAISWDANLRRGSFGLMPGADEVMALAAEEARRSGDGFVATQHVITGMLRSSSTVAGAVLASFGLITSNTRAAMRWLDANGEAEPPPAPAQQATLLDHLRAALQALERERATADADRQPWWDSLYSRCYRLRVAIRGVERELASTAAVDDDLLMASARTGLAERERDWQHPSWRFLGEHLMNDTSFGIRVSGCVRGGFLINVQGVHAFLPIAQMTAATLTDYHADLAGRGAGAVFPPPHERMLWVKAHELNRRRERAILSERAVQERDV